MINYLYVKYGLAPNYDVVNLLIANFGIMVDKFYLLIIMKMQGKYQFNYGSKWCKHRMGESIINLFNAFRDNPY